LKKQEVAKYELNIKKLMKGRIDLFAGPGDIVRYTMGKKFPELVYKIVSIT